MPANETTTAPSRTSTLPATAPDPGPGSATWRSRWIGVASWLPTSFWAAASVQTVFLIALAASDGYDVARTGEFVRVVLTYATLLALFATIHLAIPSRRWSVRVATATFAAVVTLNFARFETAGAFDYGFVHANLRELLTPLGRRIVLANVRPWEVACLFLVPVATGVSLVRQPVRPWRVGLWGRMLATLACLLLLVGLPLARISTHESLTGFLASALRFHAQNRAAQAVIPAEPFPYVHSSTPTARARALAGQDQPRPHVILLFLESWSGAYADKTRPDGHPITPVFDQRRREGLTYAHFYGNSVQSSRGHFSTLCSLIPMVRAKEFVDLPDTRLHCLPQVLADAGYRTAFFSATDEPTFDGADKFFARIGFHDARFAQGRATDSAMWGMGVQDDVFYRRFFASLDEQVAREPGTPIFAVLANASHHYPFDKNPQHQPAPGYPTKYARNYVGSLQAADAWLATFFAEMDKRPAFRDALVVLVGDHSFPADEHGIHFNGLGSYEEAFHTGFALRWPGHLPPQEVTDRAASQLDIAPTITDLLQLRAPTHFTGTSLFSVGPRPAVPLVQPYDGVRLAAVSWPYKLVRHEFAEQESLYDLASDPDEQVDRVDDPQLASVLASLRNTIVQIHANEALLRANRVWPER